MTSLVRVLALAIAMALVSFMLSAEPGSLGEVDFTNSGSDEAQEAFERGVLLLHSFEYEDAREAFREARAIDPDFALAYWGEAMTFNHPLWRQQNLEEARAALARFAPNPAARQARATTERERAWIDAADILFGEGDKLERDLAYSERMGHIASTYPDDLEARAFYALSILGTAQGVRDFAIYMRAGAVAEEVFAANRRHPGAVHYLIHSYDDPIHAPLGLRAARVYATIAPAASHAQHMISHIYIALGDWAEAAVANENAVEVSIERRERKELGPDAVSYHALHWLEYAYLQLGRWDDAHRTLDMMTRLAKESGSETALWHHAAMRATWLVETGGLEAPDEIRTDDAQITGRAAALFANGYAALQRGDRVAALAAARRLEGALEGSVATHCATSAGYGAVSEGDLDTVDVMRQILQAAIAWDAGDRERALEMIADAAEAEQMMPLEYGPPAIVKPSHEMWGEMLLALDRPAEARAAFEMSLERAPRRTRSLAGLALAAASLDDAALVDATCEELRSIHGTADPARHLPAFCAKAASAG